MIRTRPVAFLAKPGQIVIVKPGTRHEFVELARPWTDRRCRYCRRADGKRASDGTCAGCGACDFDEPLEPARRPATVYR